jgi:hypothetical protein
MPQSTIPRSVFVLACAAGFLAFVQGCHAEPPPASPPPAAAVAARAHWMQDHLDSWGKIPLKQWVLPASHDSAMYESGWIKSLGKTQDLTIYGQLTYGIRYFDLRPYWSDGQLFIHHGPILGPKLANVLDDVRRFCILGHRELIILKFSHYDAFNDRSYQQMVKEIHDRLDPWLCKSITKGKRLAEMPVADYLQHGSVLWVLCDGGFPLANRSPGIWVYRDWYAAHPEEGDLRVFDRYADSTDYQKMKTDQLEKFDRYDGKCEKRRDLPCDLFLLSWTLTPATDVKRFSVLPNRKLAEEMKALKNPNRFGCVPNLLYADYVESANLTDVALEMNRALDRAAKEKP